MECGIVVRKRIVRKSCWQCRGAKLKIEVNWYRVRKSNELQKYSRKSEWTTAQHTEIALSKSLSSWKAVYSSSLSVFVSTNSSTNSCRRNATRRFLDDLTTSPVVGSTSPARMRSWVVCEWRVWCVHFRWFVWGGVCVSECVCRYCCIQAYKLCTQYEGMQINRVSRSTYVSLRKIK